MMKYRDSHTNTVAAEYDKEQGNPFLEALPELLGKRSLRNVWKVKYIFHMI